MADRTTASRRDAVIARLRAAGCVFAEEEADLLLATAETVEQLDAMVDQRAQGRPLEHVLGWAELCGVRVEVDEAVFVPRRRSELLVREAVALLPLRPDRPVVLDLCCGSGGVGVAVARLVGEVELHAADLDAAAVRCARRNVDAIGGTVHEGDLYVALPSTLRGRVDLVVANAPYVPSDELGLLPAEARDFEPRLALDGGHDGVALQRRVVAGARPWLVPGGALLVETSERQAPLTVAAFEAHGFRARLVTDDELEACVVVGTAPAPETRSSGG